MFNLTSNLEEFRNKAKDFGFEQNIDELLKLDLTFFEQYDKFVLINIKDYNEEPNNLLLLSKENTLVFSSTRMNEKQLELYKNVLKKEYGESTSITLLILKQVLRNYALEFEKIRIEIHSVENKLNFNSVEKVGRKLRKLTDRFEDILDLMIKLGERNIKEFNTGLIKYDYDVLTAETRYRMERSRSYIYHVSSLRNKVDIQSTAELNKTITRLTVIMTFLTIFGIVVAVPGTIGAVFGIPALSDAYFAPHPRTLVIVLIISTIIITIFGWIYWKRLKLKSE